MEKKEKKKEEKKKEKEKKKEENPPPKTQSSHFNTGPLYYSIVGTVKTINILTANIFRIFVLSLFGIEIRKNKK